MKTKRYLFGIFIAVALLQAFVPLKMVYDSEMTERHGMVYKFRTAPIDPTDPFRGKYVALNFDINSYPTIDTTWVPGNQVNLLLGKDREGFAVIKNISREKPDSGIDYITATVAFNYGGKLQFDLPFDTFYMNENKAAEAESSYREYNRKKDARPAYALVAVKDGNAVLKDVIIDGVPIREYVEKRQSNR